MMHAERGFSGENALKAAEIDKYYFFQKNPCQINRPVIIYNSLKRCFRNARVAQLVERDLAKVEAAGSSPVSRSLYFIAETFSFS